MKNWNKLINVDVPWQKAYPEVEKAAKEVLQKQKNPISTGDLVEILYPAKEARGRHVKTRNRLFQALTALSKHGLRNWWFPGPDKRSRFGTNWNPKLWKDPGPDCSRCGGSGLEPV